MNSKTLIDQLNILGRICLIGPNASGKTYTLDKAYNFEDIRNKALFFDALGIFRSDISKNRIQIQGNFYVYENEKSRGSSSGELQIERYAITDASGEIISELRRLSMKLKSYKASSGISKLKNIISELLSHNLNNVRYFFFDEPENHLDDENLKGLVEIFNLIEANGIRIAIATHSTRILELLKIKTDEIYLMQSNGAMINYTYDEIESIFIKTACKLEDDIFKCSPGSDKKTMKSKINIRGVVLRQFLSNILNSQEFYRALFYRSVFIAEGMTEKLIMGNMPTEYLQFRNFFFAGGKIFIPFFIELFLLYKVKVLAMYDSDYDENVSLQDQKDSYRLSAFLEYCYSENEFVTLIASTKKDLETDYRIDESTLDAFRIDAGNISKNSIKNSHFKPYIALYVFERNSLYGVLMNKIQARESSVVNFDFV